MGGVLPGSTFSSFSTLGTFDDGPEREGTSKGGISWDTNRNSKAQCVPPHGELPSSRSIARGSRQAKVAGGIDCMFAHATSRPMFLALGPLFATVIALADT
jgi:hypothetical protein